MKKLLVVAASSVLLLASCTGVKNCYRCITINTFDYSEVSRDTVMKCDFTSKDANEYEAANTKKGEPGATTAGEGKYTNCQVPTN